MNKFMNYSMLLCLTFGMASEAFAQRRPRIVGGQPVKDLAEAPFAVSLDGMDDGKPISAICGGSILSEKWILTAAHCADAITSVKAGVLDLNQPGKSYKIKRVIIHPQYNESTSSNDVAVAELEAPIDFRTTNLRPVILATPAFEQAGLQDPGAIATVFGWGFTNEFQPNKRNILFRVDVPVVSHEVANKSNAYGGAVDDTMLAAGFANGKKDSCQGDSGGPLIINDRQGTPVQVGVVSWGIGCARRNKYGVYSKISKNFEWISKASGMKSRRQPRRPVF